MMKRSELGKIENWGGQDVIYSPDGKIITLMPLAGQYDDKVVCACGSGCVDQQCTKAEIG